ncbi:amidohydrolase family protein [Agromyces italicus]|uniref:amidohydrolase family protein n=1 Tax=Agromyces italicus TaxID=279572 RepID=UPI0003B43662|nr:amidohydrolase [Agromyces italicus]
MHPRNDDELGRAARRSLNGAHAGEVGIVLPPFIDHHVHVQLTSPDRAVAGGIAGVVDLGANPSAVAARAARDGLPVVRYAGAFLTAIGGYPSDRAWRPDGSVREVPQLPAAGESRDRREAAREHSALPGPVEAAVDEQRAFGASVVKVVLNADAGPVFDRVTLDAVVTAAHARGLPVAVHAEGAGTAGLAIDAGADALVHAPWTERLDDALVERAVAAGQAWISTLAIHARDFGEGSPELAFAIDNLARFRAAGGRVLYGTDLGNGELPVGVNTNELELLVRAGLEASDLIEALTDPWPLAARDGWGHGGVATFVPGEPPDSLPTWLANARVVPADDLELL